MNWTELNTTLDTVIADEDFSGVVELRHRGKVMVTKAAGYADRSNKIPNTLETRFGIASGTKFFTALAIGKLIEAGKLDFETRVSECIPWNFPKYSREITIRQLLTHTSGIPDYYDEEKIEDFDNFKVAVPWSELRSPKDYLAVFPDEEMKFAPGARFSYSNGGYIVLGVVVETLSGMPYRTFVEQEIFAPIGIDRSGYFAMNKLPENTAFGYIDEADGEWRTNIYNLPIIGASDGGAYTTLADMHTLWEAFWGYKILSEAMVTIYTAPYVKAETEGPDRYYGHGIWLKDEPDADEDVYIIGCDAGVSFKSGNIRAQELQYTVMSNTTNGAWPVLKAINDLIKRG